MVPEPLRGWLVDVAMRACFPLEFVAVPALVAAGAVIGRGVGITPARFDDFLVVPNLWGGVVARPGLMKSFAIAEGTRPLSRLAASAGERFKEASKAQMARRVRLQAESEALKSQMVQDAKKGTGRAEDLERRFIELQKEIEASTVAERRYITHDATVESFDRLLSENPRGLLVLRDELAGWLRTLSKPGREGDREFYLEAWNGTGSFTRDRIGRGTVHIDAVTLSILGGIQPGKLRPFVEDALAGRQNDDGLLQRLQLLVFPDDPGPWSPPDSWPDKEQRDRAYTAFQRLDTMPDLMRAAAHVGQAVSLGDSGIPYLRLAPVAQELFDAWRASLEQRLRSKELAATPAYEAHVAKYRSLMPSLALIFHLLDLGTHKAPSPVSLEATRLAADWCEFLEVHARKVYSAELSPGTEAAPLLAAKIRAGSIADRQTVREMARHQWAGLSDATTVRAGLKLLESVGWVRLYEEETGGRPAEIVRLHPRLRRGDDA
jgi:putative DNA primase/helicase